MHAMPPRPGAAVPGYVPVAHGTATAQEIYRNPADTERYLTAYAADLAAHYDHTGMARRRPEHTIYTMLRNLLRVVGSVLLFEVEKELLAVIADRQHGGEPLAAAGNRIPSSLYKRLTRNDTRNYPPPQLHFLRIATALSHAAGVRAMAQISRPESRLQPVWQAFIKFDNHMSVLSSVHHTLRARPRERLLEHAETANATAMDLVIPAAKHLGSGLGPEDIPAALRLRAGLLSRAAGTKDSFFRTYIGEQYAGAPRPHGCPFSHDPAVIAAGGIWANLRPFQHEALVRSPGFCPENIPFYDPATTRWTTGAELRLTAAIAIAAETLWTPR